jgi:alkylated DNA nucleotide flippase Atl1
MATVEGLPWWRVVRADGRLLPGHEPDQARRLRAEGVTVRNARIVRPKP